jgi:hypothetical protein
MTTVAYLVFAATGDQINGIDVALLDGVQALKSPAVRSWMARQGYSADNPSELMYLCGEPPQAGWEFLAVELDTVDAAVLAAEEKSEMSELADDGTTDCAYCGAQEEDHPTAECPQWLTSYMPALADSRELCECGHVRRRHDFLDGKAFTGACADCGCGAVRVATARR